MFLIIIFTLLFSCYDKVPTAKEFSADKNNGAIMQPDSVEAKIVMEKENEIINIKGVFYNFTDSTYYLFYEMESRKFSNSGSSKSRQSGEFKSSPKSEKIFTKVGLNVDKSTSYEIILRVFENGKLISSDSLSLISNQ